MGPDAAQQLAQAGPWAVVVAIGIALGIAFVRGWIVPRFVFDREVQRADAATASATAVSLALKELTEEVRWDVRDRRDAARSVREHSRDAAP